MKYQYSVEFPMPEYVDSLVEYLRYAQVISVNFEAETLTVHCPAGIGTPETWANSNVERLASFGIEATARRRKT